jgi:Tol biopolymer transport system component/tRNA A-37 threonylcarbamoyl transferase component Bud32
MIGKTISHYRILEKLGEGGMGVVYKARDTHLDRFVAIKVLPAERVADPERKKRFVQEAKTASALNHPNIIHVYDIDQQEGTDFLAMEYVQGRTLDQLIPRHGMRLNETLKTSVQMADALAAAHGAGIVHRDLKPANVMVSENGLVKILDFGLAKLAERSDGSDPDAKTIQPGSDSQTEEGTILGTVSYMSPEQAEGKKVDARSDIFSFGSVLYEMTTGQRAFQGDSKMSTLAAILNKDPRPLKELAEGIPYDLEKIITRCLRKDPSRRFQTMADLKVALEELKEESDSGKLLAPASAGVQRRRWKLVWATWLAALLLLAAVVVWFIRPPKIAPRPELVAVPLTSYPGVEMSPSFSPDGNQVAFSWNGEKQDNFDIYLKLIDAGTPVRLTTDPADDFSPAFSPDGRSIGFFRVSKERASFIVIPAIGGPERQVAEVALPNLSSFPGRLFDWLPDGKWVVTCGLALLSMETGETRNLTSPPTKSAPDFSPAVSPDGRSVAFSRSAGLSSDIYLLDLSDDLKLKGEPRRLTFLKHSSSDSVWSSNGLEIIFSSGALATQGNLFRVAASGAGEPERLPFASGVWGPATSRSGNRLVYEQWAADSNIWRLPLSGVGVASGSASKLIASTYYDEAAQYSPDGKRIAFESTRSGAHAIWVSDADGSNAVELVRHAGATCGTARWSPDGQHIAFDFDPEGNLDIYVIRASGGKPLRLTTDPADDDAPSWSRDGKWVYFTSIRTGRPEVWKVPPTGGQAVQVTRNGGGTAFDSPDGKSIYYIKGRFSGSLWKMLVSDGAETEVLPFVYWRAFCIVNDGIYFIPERRADGRSSIQFLSFATNKVTTVAPVLRSGEGLSVSPDGQFLLFSQRDEGGSDLMLVENFR